jgi:hypothetical protein
MGSYESAIEHLHVVTSPTWCDLQAHQATVTPTHGKLFERVEDQFLANKQGTPSSSIALHLFSVTQTGLFCFGHLKAGAFSLLPGSRVQTTCAP